MNGQWLGTFTGTTSSGSIALDLDDLGNQYAGQVFLVPNDRTLSPIAADLLIPKGVSKASLTITLLPIDRRTANPLPQADGSSLTSINTEWDISRSDISIKWIADDKSTEEAKLSRKRSGQTIRVSRSSGQDVD
jgi:hypothetical protein